MENVELKIKGMHCNSCAELIKDRLSRMPGVEKADASYAHEKVNVTLDPKRTSLREIEGAIKSMGYSVSGYAAPSPSSGEEGEAAVNATAQEAAPQEAKTEANTKTKTTHAAAGSGAGAKTSLKEGLIYGLTPHIGCIGFIAASVLGVTVAVQLFRPLLMNPWFFYILMAVSFGFATVSSVLYLRKQGILSWNGVKRKKGYLATMYGSTMGINLFLFIFAFPMLANLDTGVFANPTGAVTLAGAPAGTGYAGGSPAAGVGGAGAAGGAAQYSTIRLQVSIPCSGHAGLISGDLKTIQGVVGVKFESPNYFDVAFDPKQTSKDKILALEIFKTYGATVISEQAAGSGTAGAANFATAGSGSTAGTGSGTVKAASPLGASASGTSAGGSCGGSGGCSCGGK